MWWVLQRQCPFNRTCCTHLQILSNWRVHTHTCLQIFPNWHSPYLSPSVGFSQIISIHNKILATCLNSSIHASHCLTHESGKYLLTLYAPNMYISLSTIIQLMMQQTLMHWFSIENQHNIYAMRRPLPLQSYSIHQSPQHLLAHWGGGWCNNQIKERLGVWPTMGGAKEKWQWWWWLW